MPTVPLLVVAGGFFGAGVGALFEKKLAGAVIGIGCVAILPCVLSTIFAA
jgi:hypothetical protein